MLGNIFQFSMEFGVCKHEYFKVSLKRRGGRRIELFYKYENLSFQGLFANIKIKNFKLHDEIVG